MNKEYINELANNEKSTRIYLIHIFNMLHDLKEYKNVGTYGTVIDGLYQDFYFKELIEKKWGDRYLSDNTRNLGLLFHNSWKTYVYNSAFGADIFAYYDQNWYEIVKNKLIPFLESFDNDLIEIDLFEDITNNEVLKRVSISKNLNTYKRPSDDDIIWKVSNLYQLLIDKKIISKPFMGDD